MKRLKMIHMPALLITFSAGAQQLGESFKVEVPAIKCSNEYEQLGPLGKKLLTKSEDAVLRMAVSTAIIQYAAIRKATPSIEAWREFVKKNGLSVEHANSSYEDIQSGGKKTVLDMVNDALRRLNTLDRSSGLNPGGQSLVPRVPLYTKCLRDYMISTVRNLQGSTYFTALTTAELIAHIERSANATAPAPSPNVPPPLRQPPQDQFERRSLPPPEVIREA